MTADIPMTLMERIAAALERLAPPPPVTADLTAFPGYIWEQGALRPVETVDVIDLDLLVGLDAQRDRLLENTRRFAAGLPANNALLWGARGAGKSALVKAVHARVGGLALVELHRDDLPSLPALLRLLKASTRRFLLFCDDLSFDAGEAHYKALKSVLEGGIEGRPANCLFYATSNQRHLMPRLLIENDQRDAVNPRDMADDKLALSDRFGLWLGFHALGQEAYLAIVRGYAARFGLAVDAQALEAEALAWSVTRGARSGRVAWQFIQDLAGRLGVRLDDRKTP